MKFDLSVESNLESFNEFTLFSIDASFHTSSVPSPYAFDTQEVVVLFI